MTFNGICTVSKWKTVLPGNFQHVQVNFRALVAGEADVPKLAGLLGLG